MEISQLELERLNFYRASELHGGLVLGQLVTRTRDPWLVEQLTRHSAEEVRHSQIWAETMVDVGGKPMPLRGTYQSRLGKLIGGVSSLFQVLALTQVFERRVYRHFLWHDRMPDTHPRVREALEIMLQEEKHHLSWVRDWLEDEAKRRGHNLNEVLRTYQCADDVVYEQLLIEYQFQKAA